MVSKVAHILIYFNLFNLWGRGWSILNFWIKNIFIKNFWSIHFFFLIYLLIIFITFKRFYYFISNFLFSYYWMVTLITLCLSTLYRGLLLIIINLLWIDSFNIKIKMNFFMIKLNILFFIFFWAWYSHWLSRKTLIF